MNILDAYDGTRESKEAARVATRHAKEFNARIILAYSMVAGPEIPKKEFEKAEKELQLQEPHLGEERPLVGAGGSETIFFGNCNLGCIFCQNWTISHRGDGREMSPEKLAHVMLELQESGCHNINLVTPTHHTPMILRAVMFAVEGGLDVPIVYNCGGYESVETLKLLEDVVDIYMPDIKYSN